MARKVEAAMVGNDLIFVDTGTEIDTPKGGRPATAPNAAVTPVTLSTASESGDPGGSSILHQATVTLTDAQIKALPTTPFTVVAAAGANYILIPVAAWFPSILVLRGTGGTVVAYDNIDGSMRFLFGSNVGYLSFGDFDSFLTYGADVVWTPTVQNWASGGGGQQDVSLAVNVPLTISCINGSNGDFTAGDAANTLTVSVGYLLYNVVSGEFE